MSATVAKANARPVTPRGSKRLPALDGIRGLAAIALLTVHVAMIAGLLGTRAFGTPKPPSDPVGAFFVSGLSVFIAVFFMVPGMFFYLPFAKAVIAGTKPAAGNRPVLRRMIRLLPAYWLMCAVALLTLNRSAIDSVWYFLRPMLLLHFYTPSPFVPNLMNGLEVTWTVPSMIEWYLALPVLAWAVHKFAARGATPVSRARRLMLPVPVLIAIGVGWLFFVKAHDWDNRIVFWWPQGFAPEIGVGMALGVMLALAQVAPESTPRLLRLAISRPNLFWLSALVVYVINCLRPFSTIGMDSIYSVSGLLATYLLVVLFGLSVMPPLALAASGTCSVQAKDQMAMKVLGARPLAYLGRISYGIYLWHFAIMYFFFQPGSIISGHAEPLRTFYAKAGFWQLWLITMAGAALMASLSYYLVERPVIAWSERYLAGRKRGEATAARLRLQTGAAHALTGPVMTAEQAAAAVAAAAGDREAIQANLLDLDNSSGKRLLSAAGVVGLSKQRWTAASTELAALWELFIAYSAVVEQAESLATAGGWSGAALAEVTRLLNGPGAVVVTRPPAPLAQRDITDNGRLMLTVPEAVAEMRRLFTSVAQVVTAAEDAWNHLTDQLDAISADLAEARREADQSPDAALSGLLTTAESELALKRQLLSSDPLRLCPDGQPPAAALGHLREEADAACSRAMQLSRTRSQAALI